MPIPVRLLLKGTLVVAGALWALRSTQARRGATQPDRPSVPPTQEPPPSDLPPQVDEQDPVEDYAEHCREKENIPLVISKIEGAVPKVVPGLGFSVAAQIIAGDIQCPVSIRARINYKLPFTEMDPEVQRKHDKEIRAILEYALSKWEDIEDKVYIDEWNPGWTPSPGVKIYGKPDVRIHRECGGVVVGDAKTGRRKGWHWLQNKVALHAACSNASHRGSYPEAVLLKYSSEEVVEEQTFGLGQPVLTGDELRKLTGAIAVANGSSWPDTAPSEECEFCPFRPGCNDALALSSSAVSGRV